mmetsp:Transcript_9086/g.26128  ORF Transcript_9086/g.26128 Transcript_9086/m.26128 type:complete len:89 (-) Transcript_9086:1984-2250(-)
MDSAVSPYQSLLLRGEAKITKEDGLIVDLSYDNRDLNRGCTRCDGCRLVVVSGFRTNDTVAAYLWVESGSVYLWKTELSAAGASQPWT